MHINTNLREHDTRVLVVYLRHVERTGTDSSQRSHVIAQLHVELARRAWQRAAEFGLGSIHAPSTGERAA